MTQNTPLVSISSTAYNHANYIKQCIEGFLMQKTTFPFEILIHDDASTDGTAEIIKEYEKKYPDLIFPVYQKENQYSKGIMISPTFNWPRARGKYIALCEGDDYWTDPLKLQKQVEFLEENPDYGMVCTNYSRLKQDNNELSYPLRDVMIPLYQGLRFEDILFDNKIATVTALFRKKWLNEIDFNEASKFLMGDKYLWLEIAQKSKIGYVEDITSVYRVINNSASGHNDNNKKRIFIESSFDLNFHFIDKYGCSEETKEKVYLKATKLSWLYQSSYLLSKSCNRLKSINKYSYMNQLKTLTIRNSVTYKFHRNLEKIWVKLRSCF